MLPRLLNRLSIQGQNFVDELQSGDDLTTELAVLDTIGDQELLGNLDEYILSFPNFITLRARLIPLYVGQSEKNLTAILSMNGEDLEPVYPLKDHTIKAIEVIYDQLGALDSGKGFEGFKVTNDLMLELHNDQLLQHVFPVAHESRLRVDKCQKEEGPWQIKVIGTPAFYRGEEPVFFGGGHFVLGADLMDLRPVYFMLSSSGRSETTVVQVQDVQNPDHLSLGAAIRLGKSQIWLCDDLGDRHSYESIAYKQNNLAENQVDITYQLKGGKQ